MLFMRLYQLFGSFTASCNALSKACVCVLLLVVKPHVRHAHLGLYIGVNLKGRTTLIWSFGCSFAFVTAMGCAWFILSSFGIIIIL